MGCVGVRGGPFLCACISAALKRASLSLFSYLSVLMCVYIYIYIFLSLSLSLPLSSLSPSRVIACLSKPPATEVKAQTHDTCAERVSGARNKSPQTARPREVPTRTPHVRARVALYESTYKPYIRRELVIAEHSTHTCAAARVPRDRWLLQHQKDRCNCVPACLSQFGRSPLVVSQHMANCGRWGVCASSGRCDAAKPLPQKRV